MNHQTAKPVPQPPPVALVTGAADRIGAEIVRLLHGKGYRILLHFNRSRDKALALAKTLNAQRPDSVHCLQGDLNELPQLTALARDGLAQWGRLDALVNNASGFYPTPLEQATESHWNDLMGSNARAPVFLIRELAGALKQSRGCIVNITDTYARGGLKGYTIYTMAKAALAAMTRSLARELAPEVRVNAVAPGAILWPAGGPALPSEKGKQAIIDQTCLGRMGDPSDVANAVWFLIEGATYMTGQVITVDGGRALKG